jgi:hypothetical protein
MTKQIYFLNKKINMWADPKFVDPGQNNAPDKIYRQKTYLFFSLSIKRSIFFQA